MKRSMGMTLASLTLVGVGVGGAWMGGSVRNYFRPARVMLEQGMLGKVRLESPLSSESSHSGDPVSAALTEAVVVHDTVVLSAGTRVLGVVTGVEPNGRGKKHAFLALRFRSLQLPSGKRIDIDTRALSYTAGGEGERDAEIIGGGTVAGGVLGALTGNTMRGAVVGALAGTGAALATRGDPIHLQAGRVLPLRLQKPVEVQIERKVRLKEDRS